MRILLKPSLRIHGPAQLEYRNSRNKKRGIYAIDSRSQRGGRARGRTGNRSGRGGRGRGGRQQPSHIINGIDVSDPNRNFTAQEWEALGPNNGRSIVLQMRERANGRGNRGGRGPARGRGRDNERTVSAAGEGERERDVHFEDDANRDNGTRNERGGRNGRGFGRGAYGAGRS
jgi:hypothetical protein